MQAKHRNDLTVGELVIERLRAMILEGATLVAGRGESRLYVTPADRYFIDDGDGLHPVTRDEAESFRGES